MSSIQVYSMVMHLNCIGYSESDISEKPAEPAPYGKAGTECFERRNSNESCCVHNPTR